MTQQEEREGNRAGATPQASDFIAEGRQRIENLAGVQSEFWDRLQGVNKKWLDRIQSEASMTADLAAKLTSARSLTETAAHLQNWTMKHMEMATEDARRVISDTQDILAAGARFWTSAGGDGKNRGH